MPEPGYRLGRVGQSATLVHWGPQQRGVSPYLHNSFTTDMKQVNDLRPLSWAEGMLMRCYFHLISDHDQILDDEGIEVSDLESAKTQALMAVSELQQELG